MTKLRKTIIRIDTVEDFAQSLMTMQERSGMSVNKFIYNLAEYSNASIATTSAGYYKWKKGVHAPTLSNTLAILHISGYGMLFVPKKEDDNGRSS